MIVDLLWKNARPLLRNFTTNFNLRCLAVRVFRRRRWIVGSVKINPAEGTVAAYFASRNQIRLVKLDRILISVCFLHLPSLVPFGMGLGFRGAPVSFTVHLFHPRLCKTGDGVGACGMCAMVCNRAGLVRFTSQLVTCRLQTISNNMHGCKCMCFHPSRALQVYVLTSYMSAVDTCTR